MNKKIIIILLILGVFIGLTPISVNAADDEVTKGCQRVALGSVDYQPDRGCDGCLKYQDTAYYLQIALNVIKYAGVIICIALSVVDFVKTLLSEEKDSYKKVISRSLKRMAWAVVIFVLPILVMQFLKLIGIVTSGTCNIK